MTYQVLARKWRPRVFDQVVGQEHVMRALINALDNNRLHHAYLFTGTRGVGKTTLARIFSKSLNCEVGVSATPCGECTACQEIDQGRFVDLLEVDAASRTKVEDTRELLENVQYAPTRGRYKVYLIDEVHMLSTHSFNALLKTLEEPPPHVKFLLATTDPQKLPVTILSRCLQFNLKRLSVELIGSRIDHILAEEKIEYEAGAVRQIAHAADGSMRDALSLLDQAVSFGGGGLRDADVRTMLGTIDRDYVVAVGKALASGDGRQVLQTVATLAEKSPDFEQVLAELLSLFHHVALAQAVPDALDENIADRDAVEVLAKSVSPEDIQLYYQIGLLGRRDLPLAPDPRTGFEMVILRMLAFRPLAQTPASPNEAPTQVVPPSTRSPAVSSPVVAQTQASAAPARAVDENDWAGIAASLNLGGLVRQLAANCAPLECSAERIHLALAPVHASLHNAKLEKRLQEALNSYFGKSVNLTISLGEPTTETPAAQVQRAAEKRQQAAEEEVKHDETVRSLLDTFDGRIVPNSVQPLD